MANENQVINRIIQIMLDEILKRSLENLSSKEFSRREISARDVGASGKDKPSHNWTITNTSVLAKTGVKKHNYSSQTGEVGFTAPYAYYVNFGSVPGQIPFEPIYEWAWKRKAEIMADFKDKIIIPKKDKLYLDMKSRYIFENDKGTKRVRTRAEKYDKGVVDSYDTDRQYREKIFAFAYWVWKDICKHGDDPTFFFSDAIWSTFHDLPKILRQELPKMKGVRVE